jgi:HTH-type transcriptional regulator/antitoxin HigA
MAVMTVDTLDERKYGKLLAKALPRPIASEDEYDQMVALAGHLMEKGEQALSPEEGKLLELLGLLIEDFDDRHYPLGPGDPVAILTELMEARGLTQKDLWPLFGSKGTASDVLNRKRGISKTQAKKLAEFFHVSAELFI